MVETQTIPAYVPETATQALSIMYQIPFKAKGEPLKIHEVRDGDYIKLSKDVSVSFHHIPEDMPEEDITVDEYANIK